MEFHKRVITRKGLALLAKAQSGQCRIELTKAASGNGVYDSGEIEKLELHEELKSVRQVLSFSGHPTIVDEDQVLICTIINNDELTEGYYILEYGIYANDPDEGEILYALSIVLHDKADWLASVKETGKISISIYTYLKVVNAEAVEIYQSNFDYVSQAVFDDAIAKEAIERKDADNALGQLFQTEKVRVEKVEQELRENLETETMRAIDAEEAISKNMEISLESKQNALNRTVTGNDNATGTVTDTGGNLSIPIPVTIVTPVASNSQNIAGTKALRVALKIIIDNIAHLFANKADSSTVTSLSSSTQTSLGLKEDKANKNAVNGYAGLDSNIKVPIALLPDVILGQVLYGGKFNASTAVATLSKNAKTKLGTTSNTITLTNNTTAITGYTSNDGIFYITGTSGTFAGISFDVGDWLLATDSTWEKIDNTDAVTSVAGKIGPVVLVKDDIVGLDQVPNEDWKLANLTLTADTATNGTAETAARTSNLIGHFNWLRQKINWILGASGLGSKQAALNRKVTGNDNETGTVTDTGGELSVPIPVNMAAPSASTTQTTVGTRTLRVQLKIFADNIASLFTSMDGKQATLNRKVSGNDNAVGTVTDAGGELSIPIPVNMAAPVASTTQTTAGTRTLRAQLKIFADNIASLFNSVSDVNSSLDLFGVATYTATYGSLASGGNAYVEIPITIPSGSKVYAASPSTANTGLIVSLRNITNTQVNVKIYNSSSVTQASVEVILTIAYGPLK